MNQQISFNCQTCNSFRGNLNKIYKSFQHNGYDGDVIEWPKQPVAGETLDIWLQFPFVGVVNKSFWSLYLPHLVQYDGLGDHMDLIDQIVFVEGTILEIIEREEYRLKVTVEINQVHSMNYYLTEITEQSGSIFISELLYFNHVLHNVYGNWHHYRASAQGDLGHELLIWIDGQKRGHLLCFTEWGMHYNSAHCGHLILSEEDLKKLV